MRLVSGATRAASMFRVKETYTEAQALDAAASASHAMKNHKPIRCALAFEVTPLGTRSSIHAESLFWWASGTLAGHGSIEAHGAMEIAQDGPSSYWRFQVKTPSTWHREDIRVWDGIFHWPYVDMQTPDGQRQYGQREGGIDVERRNFSDHRSRTRSWALPVEAFLSGGNQL